VESADQRFYDASMTDAAFRDDAPPSTDNANDPAPHNLEAEQALLGALLIENEVFNRIGDYLQARHFYDPVHGRIFAVATEMIGKGALADPITLRDRFARDEGLAEIGGIEYLVSLADSPYPSSAAPEYARLIYDLAMRRELIRIGEEIADDAARAELEESGRAQIESAEKKLYALAETGASTSGFVDFSKALELSVDMAAAAYERDGGLSGTSTGLTDMDYLLGGLHRSDLIILAGRPSMGKTALATNIAFHVARHYEYELSDDGVRKTTNGGVVGFFSLEMSSEQLATRLLAEYSAVPSHQIRRGEITPSEFEQLRDAAIEIQNAPLHIDDTGGLSIGALAARARRLKRMHGLDLIVVDYLQLVTSSNQRRNDGRVQEVSEITQGLKALAKELDVPVLALSQLSRQVEQRDDKKPQLADLRESGSIEQDADLVMFVYREEYYKARQEPKPDTPEHLAWQEEMQAIANQAEVIIGKQRHGPIGTVKLSFEGKLTKFGNLDTSGRYSGGHE